MILTRKLRDLDVSAASGLVSVGDRHYVIADDDLALHVYPGGDRIALFPGELPEWDREQRKRLKPDLEALFALGPDVLCALGSGSRENRCVGVVVPLLVARALEPAQFPKIDLAPLYRALAGEVARVNVEGAARSGDVVRLFLRGAEGAIVDLDLDGFIGAAAGARPCDASLIRRVHHVDLGRVGGVPLGFTDASPLRDGRIVFSAAAEKTDDPYYDGPVLGCVVGILDTDATLRAIDSIDAPTKIEGIHATLADDGSGSIDLLFVCDADDPAIRSPLLAATWPLSPHR